MFLHVTDAIPIPQGALAALYEISIRYWSDGSAPVHLAKKEDGLYLEVRPNSLQVVDEDTFKHFLSDVARAIPTMKGSFIVWWPMVIESGPQEWRLEDGALYIVESDIIWSTPQRFEENHGAAEEAQHG